MKSAISLITSYYKCADSTHAREINMVLEYNMSSGFDNIYLVCEHTTPSIELLPCVTLVNHNKHPTFKDLFDIVNKVHTHNTKCNKCVWVISNSDIYIPHETVTKLRARNWDSREVLALTRHEMRAPNFSAEILSQSPLNINAKSCQDVWAFVTNPPLPHITLYNYKIGTWGCDNKLAYELKSAGYVLSNPAREFLVYHLHTTQHKRARGDEVVPGPYAQVPLTIVNNQKHISL